MAESKFLKYQDKNSDGLIDACEDKAIVADIDSCPGCKPNASAVVPNWRELSANEPFFNEREALYQVAITTPDTTTGASEESTSEEASEILREKFDLYVYDAILSLLANNDKDTSSSTQQGVKPHVEYSDYYLDVRPGSVLVLLYSIPCNIFNAIIDAEDSEEEAEDSSEDESESASTREVTYDTSDFLEKLKRVRQGIGLYSNYLKIYRATEAGNLVYESGPAAGSIFDSEMYGDVLGLNRKKLLYKVGSQLVEFLNNKGLQIPGEFWGGFTKDVVRKITFKFNHDYKLVELLAYTEDCGSLPQQFKGSNLAALGNKDGPYKDPTAMNYLANLDAMDRDLTARIPKPWLDFMIEYTYPKVYSSINHAHDNDLKSQTGSSCLANTLKENAIQLGQDVLDETFGLADAILYKFNDRLCKDNIEELLEEDIKLGLIRDPNESKRVVYDASGNIIPPPPPKSLWVYAQEQAFREIENSNTPFDSICALIMDKANGASDADETINKLFTEDLAKIKMCGMSELMMEAIQCLFKGLTLEAALSKVLKSALQAMSIDNFSVLFIGLPAEKQAEIDALAKKKITSGDIFRESSEAQEASDTLATAAIATAPEEIEHPQAVHNREDSEQSSTVDKRPLAKQFDVTPGKLAGARNKSNLDPNVVLQAYILAILEVYQENYLDLLKELNQFPGADIVARLITTFDCPGPPNAAVKKPNFINDREGKKLSSKICDNKFDIVFPAFKNPYDWLPKTKDLYGILQQAAVLAIQEMVIRLTTTLLTRVCSSLASAACASVQLAASLPLALSGRNTLKDLFKESLCGEGASDDMVDDAIAEALANLGLGSAAFADKERLAAFVEDASASSTAQEWCKMFNGAPAPESLRVIDNLINFEYTEYREALPTKEHIASMFTNIGKLMPAEARNNMANCAESLPDDTPANPSICATPQQLEDYEKARCLLMRGRATEEQCRHMQPDMAGDLEQISGWMQSSPLEIPSLFSDPGCDNGILPFEPETSTKATSVGIGNQLEALKNDFSTDMLGNGPWESDYGFLNMVLSDTQGNPYTVHSTRIARDIGAQQYVDFYVKDASEDDLGNYASVKRQYGAFPVHVAGWLRDQMDTNDINFNSSDRDSPEITFSFYDNHNGYGIDGAAPKISRQYDFYLSDSDKIEDITSMKIFLLENKSEVKVSKILIPVEDLAKTKIAAEAIASRYGTIDKEIEYSFSSRDDTLDNIDIRDYPRFQAAFSITTALPQGVLLHEIFNQSPSSVSVTGEQVNNFYDSYMSIIANQIKQEVTENEEAFLYGATFDNLTTSDLEYVVSAGQADVSEITLYSDADIDAEDEILGKSRMEVTNTTDNRVFYLDPKTFGGSYMNPPLYIKPVQNKGWLGFVNIMFPELSPCKPSKVDLIDFNDIQERITKTYAKTPEDARLKSDPECFVEIPYHRILERPSVAGIEGTITAAIRIYASVHFMKSLATFTKFRPTFPENFSSMYADFIIEDMKKSFMSAQGNFREAFNTFKDDEFWYAFLEQAVQLYDRRSDPEREGDITNPPAIATEALIEINDLIENLEIQTKKQWRTEKALNIGRDRKYQEYKDEKVFEFIQETENLAKVLLKELVVEQLEYMGEKFLENLSPMGMDPEIYDLAYYLLETFTQGSTLELSKENFKESYSELEEGDEQYTSGGDFRSEDGASYIGYYHSDVDGNGNIIFMAGKEHATDLHDTLTPLDTRVIVPIGDIADYRSITSFNSTQPFVIEKYISINGAKYDTATALQAIKLNDNSANISDFYPGTLKQVTDANDRVVGLEGALGVRYGLEFSAYLPEIGEKIVITTVEIDALDTTIGQMIPLEANSKTLLCLINNLKENEKFKLIYQYIFPLNKMTSFMAIYNDLGFLSSIGQKSVPIGEAKGNDIIDSKPGQYVTFENDETIIHKGKEGWAHPYDRDQRIFVNEYDNWDKEVLKNSKQRIKQVFKGYYYSRNFDPMSAFEGTSSDKPSFSWVKNLKMSYAGAPGEHLFTWRKKRMIRDNPFNSEGTLCKKKE